MAQTAPTPITVLPTAPSTSAPSTFAALADAFIASLAVLRTETNAISTVNYNNAVDAYNNSVLADADATATAADAIATAADRVQTGLDAIASAASAAAAAAIAGAFVGTSTTSWTPAIESKAFTTQTGEQYTPGIWVTVVSAGTLASWGFGEVTEYNSGTGALTVDIQVINNAAGGAKTDWNISLAGARGAAGAGVTEDAVGFHMTGGTTPKTLTVLNTGTAAVLGANTFTGEQSFVETRDTVYSITDGAAFEIDPANGNVQTITLGASRTPKATNFAAGQMVELLIDDGTAYTITWTDGTLNPTWLSFEGTASAPTLATSGYTSVILEKVGSTMYARLGGKP